MKINGKDITRIYDVPWQPGDAYDIRGSIVVGRGLVEVAGGGAFHGLVVLPYRGEHPVSETILRARDDKEQRRTMTGGRGAYPLTNTFTPSQLVLMGVVVWERASSAFVLPPLVYNPNNPNRSNKP